MSEFSFLSSRPGVAYLFPGQGSQYVGMGRDLADRYSAAHDAFSEADDVLGFSLSSLCFDGPEDVLTDTINAQPALMATSVAAMRALQSQLPSTAISSDFQQSTVFLAGHSMGEYSALVAAGSLTYADGLRLVRERGRLMKEAGERAPGMMAAILGLGEGKVAEVCADCRESGGVVQVANDNCPGQIVISGDKPGMECAMRSMEAAGARKVVPLAVSIASHSPLMESAVDELRAAVDSTVILEPQYPVIGNTTASPMTDPGAIRHELTAQLTGPVRWTESLRFALAEGVSDFVEIGAGEVLVGLVRRTDRKAGRHTVGDGDAVESFAAWLAGAETE